MKSVWIERLKKNYKKKQQTTKSLTKDKRTKKEKRKKDLNLTVQKTVATLL
jgi:hypothetical protein